MTTLGRLRQLNQQATIPPWRVRYVADDSYGNEFFILEDLDGAEIASGYLDDKAQLELIAAMRNHLPALLDIAEAAAEVDAVVDPDEPTGWAPLKKLAEALARLEQS